MGIVLDKNGFGTGGLNFDAKLRYSHILNRCLISKRRESVDIEDLFIAHIASMDAWAKGLKIAAQIKEEGILKKMVKERYSSWDSDFGKKVENGECSFEDVEKWLLSQKEREPEHKSGKQEKYESIYHSYF